MPRPRANPQQNLRAHQLFSLGRGQKEIFECLQKEFEEECVTERTIGNWIREFKEKTGPNLDVPFQWHRLAEFGFPWESSEFLLEMWASVIETNAFMTRGSKFNLLRPTARDARWWWRVHNAAPDLSLLKKRLLGSAFAFRERSHEILGSTLELGDLESYLAYKPWVSSKSQAIYERAIDQGHIPALLPSGDQMTFPTKEYPWMWPPDFLDVDVRDRLLDLNVDGIKDRVLELEKEAQQ